MATPDERYDAAIATKDAGDLEGAVAQLKEICSEHPEHTLTHSALAVHLQKLGQYDEAIAHAKKVIELEPNDPFSYTQMSVICQRCGRIQEAEDAMAKAHQVQAGGH